MPTLQTLPTELRLHIFSFVLLSFPTIHPLNVAFGESGLCEALAPNVIVTLPASALISNNIEQVKAFPGNKNNGFYNGVAGKKASLWDSVPLLAVNRHFRDEGLEIWKKHDVKVGTWLSWLLEHAPPSLLDAIRVVEFDFNITGGWRPDVPDRFGFAMDAWVRSINEVFFERCEALRAIQGLRWAELEVQHRLQQDSVFTYRIRGGTAKREELGIHATLCARAVREALGVAKRKRRWPEAKTVIEGVVTDDMLAATRETGDEDMPHPTMWYEGSY